jgi:serine/threonine protein kinase
MKTIGKYQILKEIGCSTAGKTYIAFDNLRKHELALKVLESSAMVTAELKDEFCRDLTACVELQHAHLAKIRDVGEVDAVLYIARDLLAGADLRAQLEEQRVIPLARKLELMAQVCDGLAAAHLKGIAHGNIKPGNLFIAANGDAEVLDFGTGRWLWLILSAGARPEKLYPNYFAPEQILGQPFDARSDVFSTALVMYEWLTGKYPFPVPAGLIPREIVHTELEPLRKTTLDIPEGLSQLVTRALNKDREQRVQTAAEFGDGLRGIIRQLEAENAAAAPHIPVVAAPTPPIPLPPALPQPTAATAPPPQPAVATPSLPQPRVTTAPLPLPTVTKVPLPRRTFETVPPVAQPGRSTLFRKRLIVYSIAGVLALFAFWTLLSRQNIRASQGKLPAPAASVRKIDPVSSAKPALQAKAVTPLPVKPTVVTTGTAAVVAPVNPAVEETALLAQVKSAWQAGAYTRATRLVNQILASNPDSAEARLWKKRIRSSQDAEEDMK